MPTPTFFGQNQVFGGLAPPAPLNLVFIDGSEHVLRPDEKWKDTGNSTAPVSGITGMDGKCYDDQTFSKGIVVAPLSEFTVRFDLVIRDLPASGDELITRFITAGGSHLVIQLLSTGAITVGGPFGTHTTASIYAINTKYEIEFYGLISNSGAYRLMVDDVVPSKSGGGTMDQSGIDTQDGATGTFSDWDCGDPTINTYTDNHALNLGNADIGPGQVETLYPNGAGDLAQLTRGGADSGANWSQCDEATQNGNTDYVVTGVNGSTFKNQLRIGGVNYDGATTHTGIANYKSYTEIWNLDPDMVAAWEDAGVDGLQAGIFGIDANERDVYTFQNRSVIGTPRAVQVTTTVNLTTSRLRMSQVVVEVWVTP